MQQLSAARYRGRFAPSPTGPLHFGSLVAALGSFADARAHRGSWLVRMDDLDSPREVRGAADQILRTLDTFGFEWDGPILYQSTRHDAYAEALARLDEADRTYPCACSRREIAQSGQAGPEGPIYAGTCRHGIVTGRMARSTRIRTDTPPIVFEDRIQGRMEQNLRRDVGDFVLKRADGIHAYQLAVVVDDAFQGVSQVVRGADLMRSTPRQILLQRSLGYPTPIYAHLPLVLDRMGNKLSKSEAAVPVDPNDPLDALQQAWIFLAQPPMRSSPANLAEFWEQAFSTWNAAQIPARAAAPAALNPGAYC